ncbi:hypothetical protein PARC_a0578 [Pseudoalteromonas arctica A 37-1-2]|uniref:Uncharacterized protein n=1 Tax=Pseudoalteromonas arctica A 37-1-2 TaxID=1117313 RepID=A0A290S194_9GAMM|nr:hypothetical protein PARC_a0578 [Pseudoalteromonas arctica A 37-1-2]
MPFPTTILVDKAGAECVTGDNCSINGTYINAQKNRNRWKLSYYSLC